MSRECIMKRSEPPIALRRPHTHTHTQSSTERPSLTEQHERWLWVQQVKVCWLSERVRTAKDIRVRAALLPRPVSLCCYEVNPSKKTTSTEDQGTAFEEGVPNKPFLLFSFSLS